MGYESLAGGIAATSLGYQSKATGRYSFAGGYNATSNGVSSIALGNNSKSSNSYTIALGFSPAALAVYSTAIGTYSIAQGSYSTSIGSSVSSAPTKAFGSYSTALGTGVIAQSFGEVVVGMYNDTASVYNASVWDAEDDMGNATDRAFVVGVGQNNNSRRNALVVMKRGDVYVGIEGSDADLTVYGQIQAKNGIYSEGQINSREAIYGHTTATSGYNQAVSGYSEGSGATRNVGVWGTASGATTNYGVYGEASGGTTSYAGYFSGNLRVTGTSNLGGVTPLTTLTYNLGSSTLRWNYVYARYLNTTGSSNLGGNVTPSVSGSYSLGNSSYKWTAVYANNGTIQTSDRRYKKNIKPLEGALEKVLTLNGVTYEWRVSEFPEQNFDSKTHVGIIAQEVEKVFPELVETGENGYKSVSYEKLTPVLIEAVKEQQKTIESQQQQIDELKAQIEQILRTMVK